MNVRVPMLHVNLQKEIELVQQFITILQTETEALTNAAHENALRTTTEEKNRYAALLAEAGKQRDDMLQQSGYPTDRRGIESALSDYPELRESWDRLLELASQAKALNASNGELIALYLKHNQSQLDALRNLTGGGNLYDASGRARHFSASHKGIRAG